MKTTEELKALLPTLRCVKKPDKPVYFRCGANDWLVQVIVKDTWTSVYFADTPMGVPKFKASTVDEAMNLALNQAYEKFLAEQELLKNSG